MSVIGPRPGLWNQDILTAERDKYNANDVKPGLENDRVRILNGPLQGMEDCIRKIDRHKRKARIAVEMFGRNIDMEIGLEIIAKITQGQSDPIENDINNLRIE